MITQTKPFPFPKLGYGMGYGVQETKKIFYFLAIKEEV